MSTKTEQRIADRKAKQESQAARGKLLIEADQFKLDIRTDNHAAAERTLDRMRDELKRLRAGNGRPAQAPELITK